MPKAERHMGPGARITEKPQNFKKSMQKLIKYLHSYMPFIITAFILAAMSSILSIVGPNKISKLTNIISDGLMTGINLTKVKNIAIFLTILYLLSAAFNYIESIIMVNVANKFSKSLRGQMSHKINTLPLKYFDSHSYGDILSIVTNDIDTIGMNLHQSLGTLVSSVTLFIGSILMMFVTNALMAVTAIVSSLLGFIFMFIILAKSQKYFNERQIELGKLNGHIEEIYSSYTVVKAYNGEEDATRKFDELNKKVYDS
jgi:ATP-binding cassette subfamily B multidrug efflux pump